VFIAANLHTICETVCEDWLEVWHDWLQAQSGFRWKRCRQQRKAEKDHPTPSEKKHPKRTSKKNMKKIEDLNETKTPKLILSEVIFVTSIACFSCHAVWLAAE